MSNSKSIQCHRSAFASISEIDEAALSHIEIGEHLLMADGTDPKPSIDTRAGIEWNDTGMIVYFRGRFDTLRLAPSASVTPPHSKTHRLWELSDVYEVFIGVRAAEEQRYKEFQVSPDARWMDIDVNRRLGVSNHFWYSGLHCRSFIDEEMKVWSSVIELPWACFGSHKRMDDVWNVNFFRASGSYHGDELMAWSPTGYGEKCFHRPEHFGTIHFIR